MAHRERRTGELLLTGTCVLEGLFPILAKHATGTFPPLLFHTAGVAIAAAFFLVFMVVSGTLRPISLRHLRLAVGIAVFTVVIPFGLLFIGTQMTSGINTALVIQFEVPATFLIGGIFLGERWVRKQIAGAVIALIGTLLVLFNGSLALNMGDLAILVSALLFPVGNLFAKKALVELPPNFVLMLRYALGLVLLIPATLLFEGTPDLGLLRNSDLWLLGVYGIPILVGSKIFWYQGLRRLPLAHATSLIAISPVFSLAFAYGILGEVPTPYQFAGLLMTFMGVYLLLVSCTPSTCPAEPI